MIALVLIRLMRDPGHRGGGDRGSRGRRKGTLSAGRSGYQHVIASGLLFHQGTPGRIIAAWRAGEFDLVLSEPMLDEIARELAYPRINRRIGWDQGMVDRYISLLRFEAELVNIQSSMAQVARHLKDNPVLATLLVSRADALVTGDDDLLVLAQQYPLLSPSQFAGRLG